MEADDAHDLDSTFGGDRESLASSTTSLYSVVTRYEWQHGRRYHGYNAGKYHFPNDEIEQGRMHIEHDNQRLQMNGALYRAPIQDPQDIVDLGTGNGLWCIDMAEEHPNAQVLGIDLSPVQPEWVPPNCTFEVDDFDLEWTYGENRFDFLHHRHLIGSISNHSAFYKQAFNALKPGGWIELVEQEALLYCDDGTVPENSALKKWGQYVHEIFERTGRPFIPVEKYKEHLEDAGFTNVTLEIVKRPTCDWPKDPTMKEIGTFCALNLLEGLEGFTLKPFIAVLGWKPEEVKVFMAQVRKDIVNRKQHGYMKSCVCFGQKPMSVT